MTEATLRHIQGAIKKTIVKHRDSFDIEEIDTTELNTRQSTARIAQTTLNSLGKFLDEAVCVIPANSITLPEKGFIDDGSTLNAFLDAVKTQRSFVARSEAESNANYIQPIPMAILEYKDEILLLRRNKPGHALHDKYDVWSGGHINRADDGNAILTDALNREITEEIFIKEAYDLDMTPFALLRTNEDARASMHVGVLFKVRLKSDDVALALNQKEFRATRGSSMSGRLIKTDELSTVYDQMGDWSKFIVKKLWPSQPKESRGGPGLFNE